MSETRTIRANHEEIRLQRITRGFSQEHVVQKTGLTLKTVRNLETKKDYRCLPSTVDILSTFYGVESSRLVAHDNKQNIKLLTYPKEIIEAHTYIADNAKKILACTGSRSRDEVYFRKIEDSLLTRETLAHYRVLIRPPFKKVMQDHLLRLIKVRDPLCRYHGTKTMHIGLYEDTVRLPEVFICANERMVSVVQPSMFAINEYNTSFLIEDPNVAGKVVTFIKNLYQFSKPKETEAEILDMGLFEGGNVYD